MKEIYVYKDSKLNWTLYPMRTLSLGRGGQIVHITMHILICNFAFKSMMHPDLSLQQKQTNG